MSPDHGFISDHFSIIANKTCVEVEDDVNEEEDVNNWVEDKHSYITCIIGGPKRNYYFLYKDKECSVFQKTLKAA